MKLPPMSRYMSIMRRASAVSNAPSNMAVPRHMTDAGRLTPGMLAYLMQLPPLCDGYILPHAGGFCTGVIGGKRAGAGKWGSEFAPTGLRRAGERLCEEGVHARRTMPAHYVNMRTCERYLLIAVR